MPKFQITQVASTAPGSVQAFRSSKTDDGSAALGQSMMQVGQQFGEIANKMIAVQTANEVSDANFKSSTGLSAIKLDTSKKGLKEVNANFDIKAKKLFEDVTDGMSPNAASQFKRTFNHQYAQAKTSAMAAGLKVDHDTALAKAITQLDKNNRLASEALTSTDGKSKAAQAFANSKTIIDKLVAANMVDKTNAAKMRLKNTSKFAENAILGWITNSAGSFQSLNKVSGQIANQRFENAEAKHYWNQLEQKEQDGIRARIRQELRNLTAVKNTEEKIEKENRQNNGVKLRTEIVEILANRANDENYQIKAEAKLKELTNLMKLSDDYGSTGELRALQNLIRQGGATGMTDDKERNRVASLVSRGLTSSLEILSNLKLSDEDQKKLNNQLIAAQDRVYASAIKLFDHPDISVGGSEGRYDKRTRSKDQLTLESKFHEKFVQAQTKGEKFDAIAVATKMRDDFITEKSNRGQKEEREANNYFGDNNITSLAEFEAYIRDPGNRSALGATKTQIYRRFAIKFFGQGR